MNICPNKLKPPNHSCSHLEIDFLKVRNPQLGSPDERPFDRGFLMFGHYSKQPRIPHVCKIASLFEPELYMAQARSERYPPTRRRKIGEKIICIYIFIYIYMPG